MIVQIINLQRSIERRRNYECILSTELSNYGNKGELNSIQLMRLDATDGLNDVIIEEFDDKQAVISNVDVCKIKNKESKLKSKTIYRIFDKNYPELQYKYCLSPDDMIIRKQSRRRHLTIGEFGCMLSHLRAINNIANGQEQYGLILEDDLQLSEHFFTKMDRLLRLAPKDFGILKLDGTSVKDLFVGNDHYSSFIFSILKYGYDKNFYNANAEVLHGVSGATGYIITKNCAKKIMELLKYEIINGLEGATDILLYITLPRKYNFNDIWIVKKPIVWQSGDDSNITKMGR